MAERSKRTVLCALGGFGLALAIGRAASAQEIGHPLHLTVTPSGFEQEAGGETIDEMLARRARQSDYLFRSICRGCAPVETVDAGAVFRPVHSLEAARGR